MSKVLRFQGDNDCEYEIFGEHNAFLDSFSGGLQGSPIRYRIKAKEGSLIVVGMFPGRSMGSWIIGVQNDGDAPIPPWNSHFEEPEGTGPHPSPSLIMVVPDDATMELVQ